MSPQALLRRLIREGISIESADGHLRYRAREGVMTEELRALVAEHKLALLEALKDAPQAARRAWEGRPAQRRLGGERDNVLREARQLSGIRLFDLVDDGTLDDDARETCRAELLARADAIIAESDGRRPPPNPKVRAMFDEARAGLGARDLEERSITARLHRHAPTVAALWPEAPADASWFDWRRRLGPEHVTILDQALAAVAATSRAEDAR